ncbi:MAG: hydantoinase B/oxoprolinase family protein [Chloroflexota bacterium]|nr:MAG: hydantoinase B/oxoprolinase family protein [Chloroflexota bacterium]
MTVTIDPIARELIRSGLESAVDEMALALVRTAYSPNLKSAMDLSTAICDARGRLVTQGLTLPVHLGTVPDAMAATLARFGGTMGPGDIFILNDPYEGGTHLPDLVLVQPVFDQGALFGFVCTVAHHTDIGGRVAGGNASDSTEVYQEGLRLPPVRLRTAGVVNDDFLRILEANVRIPTKVLGDLRAQMAAGHIGEERLRELLARHGRQTLLAAFDDLLDYSERLARAEIARLPDGRYEFEDFLDDDGIDPDPIPICVAIEIAGNAMVVDFAGSAPQVRGAINSVMSFTRSTTYACVRCLLPLDIPNNEGYFRAIDVRAPSGTIVNPRPPAAVAARGLTGFRIATTVFGALAKVAPDRVPACEVGGDTGISMGGYTRDGRPFVFLEFLNCGWGGRPFADGIDGSASAVVNFSNYPAEVIENEYPLRIEEYGFLPDTGGPGLYRGGLAIVRQYRFLEESATLQIRSDRTKFPAYGLHGGQPGSLCTNTLNPDDASDETPDEQRERRERGRTDRVASGEGLDASSARDSARVARVLPAKTLLTLRHGDVFRHELAGAGGWGDPLERDPGRVLADFREGKVSRAHARQAYGVVIGEDGRVDEAGTRRARAETRRLVTPDA